MRRDGRRLYRMTLVSLFTALTIVGASIQIPLPFSPVPVTLQTLFVLLSGMLLGGVWGGMAQVLFLGIGLLFPVYASRQIGLAAILHPSFGFIVGFILAALLVGLLMRRIGRPTFGRLFALALGGTVLLYAAGLFHVLFTLRWIHGTGWAFGKALSYLLLPYLPGDLLKCAAAALAAPPILRALGGKANLSGGINNA
ncbi:MAG: biotin transporter BioY [Clostridiaceae bacterium]|nr:biotin transporter BioY [Clostridiaceae bacterium]